MNDKHQLRLHTAINLLRHEPRRQTKTVLADVFDWLLSDETLDSVPERRALDYTTVLRSIRKELGV